MTMFYLNKWTFYVKFYLQDACFAFSLVSLWNYIYTGFNSNYNNTWVMLETQLILQLNLYKNKRIPHQQSKHYINRAVLTFNNNKIIKILKPPKSKTIPTGNFTFTAHYHHWHWQPPTIVTPPPTSHRPTIWNLCFQAHLTVDTHPHRFVPFFPMEK